MGLFFWKKDEAEAQKLEKAFTEGYNKGLSESREEIEAIIQEHKKTIEQLENSKRETINQIEEAKKQAIQEKEEEVRKELEKARKATKEGDDYREYWRQASLDVDDISGEFESQTANALKEMKNAISVLGKTMTSIDNAKTKVSKIHKSHKKKTHIPSLLHEKVRANREKDTGKGRAKKSAADVSLFDKD